MVLLLHHFFYKYTQCPNVYFTLTGLVDEHRAQVCGDKNISLRTATDTPPPNTHLHRIGLELFPLGSKKTGLTDSPNHRHANLPSQDGAPGTRGADFGTGFYCYGFCRVERRMCRDRTEEGVGRKGWLGHGHIETEQWAASFG